MKIAFMASRIEQRNQGAAMIRGESKAGNEENENDRQLKTDTVRSRYSGRRAGNYLFMLAIWYRGKEQRASNRRTGSSTDAAGRAAGY